MAKDKREVKRLSGSIPVDLYERIKAYADKIGVSVSGVVAMACDQWLTAQDAQKLLAETQHIKSILEAQNGGSVLS